MLITDAIQIKKCSDQKPQMQTFLFSLSHDARPLLST